MNKTEPKKPVHRVKVGPVQANVWENESREGVFYSMTFERFYKAGDEWKSSPSFGQRNAGAVAEAAMEAACWIRGKEGAELPPATDQTESINGAPA